MEEEQQQQKTLHNLVFLLFLLLLCSFGNLCWHTNRCLFEPLHNTPTQWERTPQECWIAPCGFPLSLSLCSVARRAERGRAGQQAGDSVQINELLRARLGPVLHMKALGKWTLDLRFLDKV